MIVTTSRTEPGISERHRVETHGAAQVNARINQSVGELLIYGGAASLMEGTFTSPPDLRPVISYDVTDGVGALEVDHERASRRSNSIHDLRWDIALNDAMPIDLAVEQATGTSRLQIATLNLGALKVSKAVGTCDIDLSGNHDALHSIGIDCSAGAVDLRLHGRYPRLNSLGISAATGDISLDMAGVRDSSFSTVIHTATGQVHLRLPQDIGVEVSLKAVLSNVRAHGMQRIGNVWHNACFCSSEHAIRLRITSSIANISMEVDG